MENSKLDDFLREKLDNQIEHPAEDWNNLRSKVTFMNFFKFGLRHYNIYYTLTIIAAMAGIMSAVFGLGLNGSRNLNPHNHFVQEVKQQQMPVTNFKSAETSSVLPQTEQAILQTSSNQEPQTVYYSSIGNKANPQSGFETDMVQETENQLLAQNVTANNERLLLLNNAPAGLFESRANAHLADNVAAVDYVAIVEPVNQLPNKKRWSVEVFSQPAFTDAVSLSSTAGAGKFESLKRKQAYGANVVLEINRLFLQAGLQYTFYDKNFESSFVANEIVEEKSYKKYSRVLYGLESGKEVRTITDSVLVSSQKVLTSNIQVSNINSYKFFELPVMIGYSVNVKRFGLVAKGGIIFNLYKTKNGSINLENNNIDLDDVPFITSNFSALASLGVYYRLNSFANLLVEPFGKWSIGSPAESGLYLQTNNFAFGLKTGLAFKF